MISHDKHHLSELNFCVENISTRTTVTAHQATPLVLECMQASKQIPHCSAAGMSAAQSTLCLSQSSVRSVQQGFAQASQHALVQHAGADLMLLLTPMLCNDAGKSAKSLARGGKGLPREVGGDPLDLLDAGTSRKMVKHAAAAAQGTAAAGPAPEDEDEFEHADDGKMIIRVCWLPCANNTAEILLDHVCMLQECIGIAAALVMRLQHLQRTEVAFVVPFL